MKKEYLDLMCDEPFIIGHELGFPDLTKLHNAWIQKMMFSNQDETILAHRGSFKTTCLTIAIAFLMVLRPNNNIIFIRKTDDDVKEVINQVGKILKSNLMKYIGTMKEVTFRKKLKQGLQAIRDDPMGLHQHLEIHFEYLGGQ